MKLNNIINNNKNTTSCKWAGDYKFFMLIFHFLEYFRYLDDDKNVNRIEKTPKELRLHRDLTTTHNWSCYTIYAFDRQVI